MMAGSKITNLDAALLAVGDMFALERAETNAELAKLRAAIEAKDSASMMKGVFGQLLSANLTALRAVCDHIELRRAALVAGEPSPLIRAALSGGSK